MANQEIEIADNALIFVSRSQNLHSRRLRGGGVKAHSDLTHPSFPSRFPELYVTNKKSDWKSGNYAEEVGEGGNFGF